MQPTGQVPALVWAQCGHGSETTCLQPVPSPCPSLYLRLYPIFLYLSPESIKMQVGGQDGIQKLLAAENDAQRIVSEARKGKLLRLEHIAHV